jgi:hypothetical protein
MTRQHSLRIDTRVFSSLLLFLIVSADVFVLAAPPQHSSNAILTAKHSRVKLQGTDASASSSQSNPDSSIFSAAVMYDTGGYDPTAVAVADVNGDGKPDLIVANETSDPSAGFAASTISVLLGNGDGTFQPAATYASGGSYLKSLTVADVNHDGKLDILAANGCTLIRQGVCSVQGAVGVLLGNGDGTFRRAVNYRSGGFGWFNLKVAVADVNGDGQPDLVTVNGCSSSCDPIGPPQGSVGVLLGNGDGTFRVPITYSTGGYFANSLAVAYLNGDGTVDIVVTNYCGDNNIVACTTPGPIGILLGNGDGTFKPVAPYGSGGQGTAAVAIKDVDGDGNPDLVVASCGSEGCGAFWPPRPGGVIGVLLGKGDGTFNPAVTYGSGSYFAVAVGDVDGDAQPDLVFADWACSDQNEGCVSVLLGNGDGAFQPGSTYALGPVFSAIALADVNHDGKADLLVTPAGNGGSDTPPGTVGVLLNGSGSTLSSTTTTVSASLNPSTYGQTVTFTAKVTSSSGTPTGTVNLLNGSTTVGSGTLTNGTTKIGISSLPAGSDSITAAYQGSADFAASTSAQLAQTVKVATTTTALSSSVNSASTNQSITFRATVTSQYGGAATGSVVFSSGSQTLGSASLSGGVASLTTSFSAAGTYSVTAKYTGDANNSGSTSSTVREVINLATTITLVSSLNPSFKGQAVTFTATVSSSAGAPPNGEMITFKNGSATLGTTALSGGMAVFTTSSLAAGTYTITASYPGDANFAASTSLGLRQVVNSTTKSATAATLVSSLNPSVYGQNVTWTATVTTSGSVPPTGNVNFTWGYNIGTVALNASGAATLTRSNLNASTYPLKAVYVGDANNLSSTSPVMSQVITQTTSSATLTSSPNPSTSGQAVTFTATITSPTVTPTGLVTFTIGKTVLGTAQLSNGKAKFTTSTLAVGSNRVTATYYGDSNIARSSASVTQVMH